MKTLPRNTPIFFKTRPKTEDSRPDAAYLWPKAVLPSGKQVHVLRWHGEDWMVEEKDFLTQEEALKEAAKAYLKEIEEKKKPGMKPEDLAKALGISKGTLRKRQGMTQNHLGNGDLELTVMGEGGK